MNIAVYGSLRKGAYNYDRFLQKYGKEDFFSLGKIVVPGYKLYDLGSYPGVKESNSKDDTIVVDILELSEEAYDTIYSMERNAGYKAKFIEEEGITCTIFIYNLEVDEKYRIKEGDYISYLQESKASN